MKVRGWFDFVSENSMGSIVCSSTSRKGNYADGDNGTTGADRHAVAVHSHTLFHYWQRPSLTSYYYWEIDIKICRRTLHPICTTLISVLIKFHIRLRTFNLIQATIYYNVQFKVQTFLFSNWKVHFRNWFTKYDLIGNRTCDLSGKIILLIAWAKIVLKLKFVSRKFTHQRMLKVKK